MKKFWNYLRWSNIIIDFYLNPFSWKRYYYHCSTDKDMNPGLIVSTRVELGPIGLSLFIDDGSW